MVMRQNNELGEYISRFFTSYLIKERASSRNTVKAYRDSWKELIQYMITEHNVKQEKLTIQDFTAERIRQFLLWIEKDRKVGKITRNVRLSAIKSFFRFVQFESLDNMSEIQKILEIKNIKTTMPSRTYLTADGIKLLLEQPNQNEKKGFRDLVIFSLMFETGCRVQEIIDLSVNSISFIHESIIIVGKGNKSRIVNLSKDILSMLSQYIKLFHIDAPMYLSHPLFFNSRGERFTRQNITSLLKKYTAMARAVNSELIPEGISPHSIRHSRAMFLLEAQIPTIYIRDILGHNSISTTEIYARANYKMKREAIEKAYMKLTPDQEPQWQGNDALLKFLEGF